MSAALDTLRALVSGDPSVRLLPAAIGHGWGAETFGGGVMATALFARHPQPLSAEPHVVETARAIAVFDATEDGDGQALIADLYDGRIGRVWRVGPSELDPAADATLAVAFDPHMTQLTGEPAFVASDHPELDASGAAALEALMRGLASEAGGSRVLAVRAFGVDGVAAALLALASSRGFTLVAAAFRYGADGAVTHRRIVRDGAPAPSRLARLVPDETRA